MKRTFDDVALPLAFDLRVPAGAIAVTAEETSQVDIELEPRNAAAHEALEAVVVDLRRRGEGQELIVEVPERRGFGFFGRSPEFDLRIRCPHHADVKVSTATADFEGRGTFGSFELKSASGDVEAELVDRDVRVQTASGDVSLGGVGGGVSVQTASGDVTIDQAGGRVRAQLVSGDLTIRDARSDVDANTVSGDQGLDAVAAGSIALQSVSGDVRVGVRPGANVWMDVRSLSGDTSSQLTPMDEPSSEDAPLVELRIKSVSGDVTIQPAAAAPVDRS